MSRYRFISVIFVVLLLWSCNNNGIVKDIEEFKGQQIIISRDWHTVWKGKDTLLYKFTEAPIKLMVWYDSLSCASCQIVSMYEWDDIIKQAHLFEKWLNIIFLFTLSREDIYEAGMMFKRISFHYPVFIDQNGTFVKQNPNLPQNKQLHIFLLDKNNKVVMAGNPLRNPKLWELYKSTIQKMIENDGIYIGK